MKKNNDKKVKAIIRILNQSRNEQVMALRPDAIEYMTSAEIKRMKKKLANRITKAVLSA